MVPRKIVYDSLARGDAHSFDNFRVLIQMQNRSSQSIDIRRWDNKAFHPVVDHVARFPSCNLGQSACGRFVGYFRASLQLRRENVDGALAEIFGHVAREPNDRDVISPEFL